MTYILYYCNYIRVEYVMCAISWGRCSLIGLLVVMSVVVVLVLLFFGFPLVGVGGGGGACPLVLCSLLLLCVLDRLHLV
jgi:hypothetical protein